MSYKFEHAGLQCEVIKNRGHHCGYVGVPKSHELYGKDYSDHVTVSEEHKAKKIDKDKISVIAFVLIGAEDEGKYRLDCVFQVHGGLTYAAHRKHHNPEDELWYFGFDCAHAGDGLEEGEEGWKDQAYAEAECKALAEQLAAWPNVSMKV